MRMLDQVTSRTALTFLRDILADFTWHSVS